jgi:hypothetical protein
MEEVSMDLIENLNKSGGCQHILVVKDALTDFVLLFPLKSKTATEVARVCKYGLFQQYNIKRLHTDNGSCFRQVEFLGLMAELKIEVINTSVHKPTARGFIEKEVHIVKTIFKKILASGSNKTLNWEELPLLVSILLNHTVSLRTGYKPAVLMYGETQMANCFLDTEEMVPVHHSLRTNKAQLIRTSANVQRIIETAKETITAKRQHEHDANNENRIIKPFKKDDIVFLYDRSYVQGAPRPLRTKFSSSPHVIVEVFYTTLLVQRLADNFRTLIAMDDVKLYKGTDPEFANLPQKIKKILINKFDELLPADFDDILRLDPLEMPIGIELGSNDRDQEMEDDLPGEGEGVEEQLENKKQKGSGRKGKRRSKLTMETRKENKLLELTSQNKNTHEKENTTQEQGQEQEPIAGPSGLCGMNRTKKNTEKIESDSSSEDDEPLTLRSGKRVHFQ